MGGYAEKMAQKDEISSDVSQTKPTHRPSIGVALGSGGGRGWAHIGVLRCLQDAGLSPEIVTGTSAGAIVGAAYAGGRLAELEEAAQTVDFMFISRLFKDLSFGIHALTHGLCKGQQIEKFIAQICQVSTFEELKMPFAAVATDILNHREVVMTSGALIPAVRASMSIPFIFTPVKLGTNYLVDGALTNPVPVAPARSLGADIIVAVDINSASGRSQPMPRKAPSCSNALVNSMKIVESQMAKMRLQLDRPHILIEPRVADIFTLDFSKARRCLQDGYDAARAAIPEIRAAILRFTAPTMASATDSEELL